MSHTLYAGRHPRRWMHPLSHDSLRTKAGYLSADISLTDYVVMTSIQDVCSYRKLLRPSQTSLHFLPFAKACTDDSSDRSTLILRSHGPPASSFHPSFFQTTTLSQLHCYDRHIQSLQRDSIPSTTHYQISRVLKCCHAPLAKFMQHPGRRHHVPVIKAVRYHDHLC